MRTQILLCDDHAIVREGLKALISAEPDLEVIGEASDGQSAVRMAELLCPDVAILDISMPELNGLSATRQILGAGSKTRVLMLSAHGDAHYVEEAQALGAAGFLLKQDSGAILVRAIRTVQAGALFFPGWANSPDSVRARRDPNGRGPGSHRLSLRELEVLQLVAEGKANKQAAAHLKISIKTVQKHRQSLMEKLGIHETAGLTRYAIAAGVIESQGPFDGRWSASTTS